MSRTVNYQDVFGVPLGTTVREGDGVKYVPCPAVQSVKSLLGALIEQKNLQGTGPLFRLPGFSHEFNRHHAGLAVDIMLNPKDDSLVALGQHLVLLFKRFSTVLKFRGLIYQNVTVDGTNGNVVAGRWEKGGHADHIHIDWHNSNTVKWRNGIAAVPLQQRTGKIVQMPVVSINRIAEAIPWPGEADSKFEGSSELQNAITELTQQHKSGGLAKMADLGSAIGLGSANTTSEASALVGGWDISIGNWLGWFRFEANGKVSWSEKDDPVRHSGKWSVKDSSIQWKFLDAGDIRTFVVRLPIVRAGMQGSISPHGQGFFQMRWVSSAG